MTAIEPYTQQTSSAGTIVLTTGREDLAALFGRLEVVVLDMLWSADGPLTVKAAHKRLRDHGYTLTTVQTTLNRLVDKGILVRSDHRPATYQPALTRQAFLRHAARHVIRSLSELLGEGELTTVIQIELLDRAVPA